MVRTTLGAEVETTVTVSGSESVDFVRADATATLSANNQESVIIRASEGEIYEVISASLQARSVDSQASKTHFIRVKSETQNIVVALGRSNGDSDIKYQRSYWNQADDLAAPEPPGDQTAALRGLRIGSNNGLVIQYKNFTNFDQTTRRRFRFWVRVIQVQ